MINNHLVTQCFSGLFGEPQAELEYRKMAPRWGIVQASNTDKVVEHVLKYSVQYQVCGMDQAEFNIQQGNVEFKVPWHKLR